MSVVLKNVPSICHSCLRFTHAARRIPIPGVLPRRALIHSTRKLTSRLRIIRQPVGDIFDSIPESKPIPEGLIKLPPSDIITLKEHLDSGDLSAACTYLMGLETPTPSSEGADVTTAPEANFLANYVPDATLQPIMGRLFASLMTSGGKIPGVPKPLELLKKMEEIGLARTSYYTALLMVTIKNNFKSSDELLAVFDAAIAFNSENLREVMAETSELESLQLDTATPHFIAFIILRELSTTSESITRLENVIRHSPYPTQHNVVRFLDHHQFPLIAIDHILTLLEKYTAATLFTNHYTLTREISRATTPEALTNLYNRILTAPIPPAANVYTSFIASFISHRCYSEALACWNDMTSSGIIPSTVQWNELMKAFAKSQDKRNTILVWDMMLKYGCIPDHHCWTTRIHALLDGNNIAKGLESLRQMQASGITPTIETINAVIGGLLKHNYLAEAEAVLATAEKLGIRKDLWTYNTLLKSLMKQQKTDRGKFANIVALTREMQANDIIPDIQTVTLILDGMYKYSSPRPTIESVMSFLAYIESAGITSNTVTYTSILHALLQEGNEPAAMGILAIMQARGIIPNSATYTVLLKYYFSRSDLVSVERVLAEVEQKRINIDDRMYREIAYGFAATRQVRKMNQYLAQMHERRVFMGLLGYMSVLKMLEKQGMLLEAKNVAADLLQRGTVGRTVEERVRVHEREFWEVVAALGKGAVLRELGREGLVTF